MKLSRLLDGCDIITASGAQTMPDADIEITAVSYTHLDEYKRQL